MIKQLILISILFPISAQAQKALNTSTAGGRFQVIQLSDFRRDQYLLDTQTGKMWSKNCLVSSGEDCAYSAWRPEAIEGITHSIKQLAQEQESFEKYLKEKGRK